LDDQSRSSVRRGNGVPGRFWSRSTARKIEQSQTLKLFADDYRITTTTLTEAEQVEKLAAQLKKAPYKVSKVTRKEARRSPHLPL